MSDSVGSKSGKLRVMYVRNEDEKENSRTGDGARDRRNDNEKTGRRDNRDKDGRSKGPYASRDNRDKYGRGKPR